MWEPIRQRLNLPTARLRAGGMSYLLYAMLDAIVDHSFPILEHYGDQLEALENVVIDSPTPQVLQQVHAIKRDLALLRRVLWPMRDVVDQLCRDEQSCMTRDVRPYMRDVYEHAVQVIDIVETYREMAGGLSDMYMSAVSNRMNEIMKVLTIMASFFIPITFIAGVYGMNFEHIPELAWPYSYLVFWGVCVAVVAGLLIYFWRKGWIGRR